MGENGEKDGNNKKIQLKLFQNVEIQKARRILRHFSICQDTEEMPSKSSEKKTSRKKVMIRKAYRANLRIQHIQAF